MTSKAFMLKPISRSTPGTVLQKDGEIRETPHTQRGGVTLIYIANAMAGYMQYMAGANHTKYSLA